MRLSLLFLVLSSALVVKNVNAEKLDLAPLLQLGLRFVLLNIKRLETITFTDDVSLIIPEDYKDILIGSINLKNIEIYGFETLDIAAINAVDVDPSNENYTVNLCLNLLLDELGFSSDYDADVGIIDEIPVYGDGEINLAVSQVILDLCLNINITADFSQILADNVVLGLQLHDSPSYITRFWKSDSVSDIVSAIINILETIIFMWMDYDEDCTSTLISPIVQYALNSILPNDLDNQLVINTTCLPIQLGEEVDLNSTFQTLLTAYNEGTVANLIINTDVEQVKEIIKQMQAYILEGLTNEGFSIEV